MGNRGTGKHKYRESIAPEKQRYGKQRYWET